MENRSREVVFPNSFFILGKKAFFRKVVTHTRFHHVTQHGLLPTNNFNTELHRKGIQGPISRLHPAGQCPSPRRTLSKSAIKESQVAWQQLQAKKRDWKLTTSESGANKWSLAPGGLLWTRASSVFGLTGYSYCVTHQHIQVRLYFFFFFYHIFKMLTLFKMSGFAVGVGLEWCALPFGHVLGFLSRVFTGAGAY